MPIKSLCWLYLMQAWAEEDGTTAIEYALIISLISISIGFMIPELRAQIETLIELTSSALSAAAASSQAP